MSDRIAPRRLFLTADKSEVVGEGDERAAFLLAGKGSQIPADFDGDIPAELLEPEPEPGPVDPAADEPEKPEAAKTPKPRGRAAAGDTTTEE